MTETQAIHQESAAGNMHWREEWNLLIRDIWDSVKAQPGRVGLSFLAVLIGIASLTVLLAILGGLQERARALLGELGGNVVAVMAAPTDVTAEQRHPLSLKDFDQLAAGLQDCRVSAMRRYDVQAMGSDNLVGVIETDEMLLTVRGWNLADGRFLDPRDMLGGERHVVISGPLSRAWNKHSGDFVTLADVPFRVVGVVEVGGGAVEEGGTDRRLVVGDRVVFVPRTSYGPWQDQDRESSLSVDSIFIQAPQGVDVHAILPSALRILSAPGRDVSQFPVLTPERVLQGVKRLQQTLRLAGGSIALLCLALGGTTLMSLMVANVRERVGEIGLRRALGATGRDIAVLFVLEACAVTICASIVGQACAFLILGVAGRRFDAPLSLGWFVVFVPFFVALGLGAVFAYWPARLASRISPAEALRND